jgi:hypothetical protein
VDLSRPVPDQLADVVVSFERRYPRKARGHVGRAARIAGIARRMLSAKLAEYKIDTDEFKGV